MYDREQFLTFTERNMLRKITLELDRAQRMLAEGSVDTNRVRGCLERAASYLGFAAGAGRLQQVAREARVQLESVLEQLAGAWRPRTLFARINCLFHDLSLAADMPVGEHHFAIRASDQPQRDVTRFPCRLVLDNLRSAFNVGTIFRSCDGFGAEEICLTGITAGPDNKKVAKTAMGATEYVPWQRAASLETLLREFKQSGHTLYALETVSGSSSLYETSLCFPAVVIVGNEEFGILEDALELVDQLVHIPMFGKKNSFNVGVAASLFLYEARRQHLSREGE